MVRLKDPDAEAIARVAFMPAPKPGRQVTRSSSNRVAPLPPTQQQQQKRFNTGGGQQQHAPTQKSVCTLNLHLPDLDSTVNSEMGEAWLIGWRAAIRLDSMDICEKYGDMYGFEGI